MRDLLCNVYDKLYCFLGYTDMRLILGYESGGKRLCYDFLLYKGGSATFFLPSFSSAPPPAIEISTPWEIIVRVSSASDIPRPWQLLGGLSRLHLLPFSGAFGLPSLGLWIPFWFRSSSFALAFLPFTPHIATRLA